MFGKIVVESDGVALGIAEIFAHGAGGEGREVLHGCGLGGGGGDYDGVVHGAASVRILTTCAMVERFWPIAQ